MTNTHPMLSQFERMSQTCKDNGATQLVELFDGTSVVTYMGQASLDALTSFTGTLASDIINMAVKEGEKLATPFNGDNVVGASLFMQLEDGSQVIHQAQGNASGFSGNPVIMTIVHDDAQITAGPREQLTDVASFDSNLDRRVFARQALNLFRASASPDSEMVEIAKYAASLHTNSEPRMIVVLSNGTTHVLDQSEWSGLGLEGFNANKFVSDVRKLSGDNHARLSRFIYTMMASDKACITAMANLENRTIQSARFDKGDDHVQVVRRPIRLGVISRDQVDSVEKAVAITAVKIAMAGM